MNVDVIILTNSVYKNTDVCERTIRHLHDSENDYQFKVHLVDSGEFSKHIYKDVIETYIHPNQPFNYNRFINIALQHVSCDWVLISNDDVGYERGWFTEMMRVHSIRPDIESFSPKDPMLYMIYFDWHFLNTDELYFENYKVTEGLMGWSILIKKTALDRIVPFDDQFDLYYQDNDYAEVIKSKGIKHALVRHSIAVHRGTIRVDDENKQRDRKMKEDELKFRTKWKLDK
jgi:GT2 family glycosyltransferase